MNKTISALAHSLVGGNQERGGQTISYDGAMKEDCTVEGVGERIGSFLNYKIRIMVPIFKLSFNIHLLRIFKV